MRYARRRATRSVGRRRVCRTAGKRPSELFAIDADDACLNLILELGQSANKDDLLDMLKHWQNFCEDDDYSSSPYRLCDSNCGRC